MARIDSILGIAIQQGCDELRVATDAEPRMFARGVSKRIQLPATSSETLHDLLGEILPPEREAELTARGRLEVRYRTEGGVAFDVTLSRRGDGGTDVRFAKSTGRSTAAAVGAPMHTLAFESSPRAPTAAVAPAPHAESTDAPHATPESVRDTQVASPAAQLSGSWTVNDGSAELFLQAFDARASDLHLREGEYPSVRLDGRILRFGESIVSDLRTFLALEPAAARLVDQGGSLDRSIELPHPTDPVRSVRARVHVYRTSEGMAAAIRFLPSSPPDLVSLGAGTPLDDLVHIPHGLVLVCGATGSGKSTTLASLAEQALHRRSIALVTLEHPIEYRLTGGQSSIVRQREVGRDVVDFPSGLRDVLREDPDVVMVGEMRDPETIALALTAAETGHLVLATLHSGSCATAIERIVDAYPSSRQGQIRTQLADVLRVVLAQRLLPRARGTGRVLAVEVLRVNHAASSMIRDNKTYQIATLLQSSKKDGMVPLERALADRVLSGEVRLDDARAAANDAEAFNRYVTPAAPGTSGTSGAPGTSGPSGRGA